MKVSNVCVEKIGDVVVAVIPGEELDASNMKEFKGAVESLLESNSKVVFDLSELQFVDSSGCGALLSCLRSMNASGGDLKLCSVTKQVRALFELIRMHHIFDILNTKEEAVRAFRE
ncbi:MAG: STAS domain-containing protein [Planctomycetota bacterium]